MVTRLPLLLFAAAAVPWACTTPSGDPGGPLAQRTLALGEPVDGFPSWFERVVHVWTNRARSDPAADLASCSSCAESACYAPAPPVEWHHELGRAARFHSDNLVLGGCNLQHDSPCTLVSNLGAEYTPGPCNGAASCSCTGSLVCGSVGTGFSARIGLFASIPGGKAENIARGSTNPVTTFYQWLHEPESSTACGFRLTNGHRHNILNPAHDQLGVGRALGSPSSRTTWTQDFARSGSPADLVAGVHYPQTGATGIEFRANWYAAAPNEAIVNVGGNCRSMTVERGSATNGTYLATVDPGAGCVRYAFEFVDGSGSPARYPTTGSYGIGCGTDWDAAPPPTCGCTPSCGGNACGSDGCGSTCGTCSPGATCTAGQCACSGSCAGRECGDDGCGTSCGSCPTTSHLCSGAGQCTCRAGRTECANGCVNTQTAWNNCGGCGIKCPTGQACVMGACECRASCTGRECGDDGCGGSCGACSAGETCTSGDCICSGSLVDCNGDCVDVRTDEQHCGACGLACASGETCQASVCAVVAADAGCTPDCSGRACGDDACGGSCGDCSSDRSCAGGGQCQCTDGLTDCGECIDTRSDGSHCGECDRACDSSERCLAGACEPGGDEGDASTSDAGEPAEAGAAEDAGDAGDAAAAASSKDSSGCACRVPVRPGRETSAWIAFGVAGLLRLRRRRREP